MRLAPLLLALAAAPAVLASPGSRAAHGTLLHELEDDLAAFGRNSRRKGRALERATEDETSAAPSTSEPVPEPGGSSAAPTPEELSTVAATTAEPETAAPVTPPPETAAPVTPATAVATVAPATPRPPTPHFVADDDGPSGVPLALWRELQVCSGGLKAYASDWQDRVAWIARAPRAILAIFQHDCTSAQPHPPSHRRRLARDRAPRQRPSGGRAAPQDGSARRPRVGSVAAAGGVVGGGGAVLAVLCALPAHLDRHRPVRRRGQLRRRPQRQQDGAADADGGVEEHGHQIDGCVARHITHPTPRTPPRPLCFSRRRVWLPSPDPSPRASS